MRGLLFLCLLVGCSPVHVSPPGPVTIPDPLAYLAQSLNCDGRGPLMGPSDAFKCRRFDFGRYQIEDSFLDPDGGAITDWSYSPFGLFDPAAEAGCPLSPCRGDGGEHYTVANGVASIDETRDGGTNGNQHFSDWWLFDNRVPDCAKGWEYGGKWGRACRTTVTYPQIGAVDTIISEHDGSHVERFYFGRGWGRLGWEVWAPSCPVPLDPARAPPMSFDAAPTTHPDWVKCDERLVVNVEPWTAPISGIYEWHP